MKDFNSLFKIVILSLMTFMTIDGYAKDKNLFIDNQVHVIKKRKKKLKVYYNNLVIKIPKEKVSNEDKIDSLLLEEYCKMYYKGATDSYQFDESGKPKLAGIVLPIASTLWTTIFRHPNPTKNKELVSHTQWQEDIDNPIYKKAYNKTTRNRIRKRQIEGTTTMILTATLITSVIVLKYLELNE